MHAHAPRLASTITRACPIEASILEEPVLRIVVECGPHLISPLSLSLSPLSPLVHNGFDRCDIVSSCRSRGGGICELQSEGGFVVWSSRNLYRPGCKCAEQKRRSRCLI